MYTNVSDISYDILYSCYDICYTEFSNMFVTFMIRHSVACGSSEETHFCLFQSSHLFFFTMVIPVRNFRSIYSYKEVSCFTQFNFFVVAAEQRVVGS